MAWYDSFTNPAGLAGALGGGMMGVDPSQILKTSLGQTTDDPAIKAQQAELAQQLRNAAMGNAPSAAEMQQKQAMSNAAGSQFGLAMSQPGMAPGAAMHQASMGTANAQQDIAGQTAQLRAQEQERARMLYMQQLEQMRKDKLARDQINAQALGQTMQGVGKAATAGA